MSGFNLLLARQQVELFHENNTAYIKCLAKSEGLKSIFLGAYNQLVKENEIQPIESLPMDEKKQLWDSVNEFSEGIILSVDQKIRLTKSLYTLEYLLN